MERYFRTEYGRPNFELRNRLFTELGPNFQAYTEQVINYGITRITGIFSPEEVADMQRDITMWEKTKKWDKDNHIGFDGNSGEQYLQTSEAISRAVTHPALHMLATAALGQHLKMNFIRTVLLNPTEPYERRAFQWHHDGHSEFGLRAMFLLTDVPDNGQAMLYVPSSHKRRWGTSSSRETKFNPEFAEQFNAYVCSGKAGDLIVFNQHGMHRGQRNDTLRRDVVLINFQPGLARNYPVSNIAPEVANRMSDYEKHVFGVEGHIESGSLTEANFSRANATWREKMDVLYREYTPPIQQLQHVFDREQLDERINEAGEHNVNIHSQTAIFVDSDVVRNLEEFKLALQTELHCIDEELAVTGSINQALSEYGINLREQIVQDMHGDLDLPVRMYHPNRDQRRDNAITQTRDGRGDQIIEEFVAHLDKTDYGKIVGTNATLYETIANQMLQHRDKILTVPENQQTRLNTDSFLSLIEDLSEMIKRAYNVGLVRKTMLYTYLATKTLADKYADSEKLTFESREQMAEVANKALAIYIKLLFLK